MAELQVELSLPVGPIRVPIRLATTADRIGIVGPSGSGKTTLLRVLAGLERRAVGRASFAGVPWQGDGGFVPAWERRVGWVPQDPTLFPHLSVRGNLAYGGRLPVEPIADALGLRPLLDRAPRNLSGGERQRVALGRALASEPRLLLLDEPFSALDRALRRDVVGFVDRFCRERSIPFLLVSHDAHDVAALVTETWELTATGLQLFTSAAARARPDELPSA